MQKTIKGDTITLTATIGELWYWQQNDLSIYATPPTEAADRASEVYLGNRPRFKYDFVFASVEDFCQAEGWDHIDDPDAPQDYYSHLTEAAREFAAACYDQNTLAELSAPHAPTDADQDDMTTWGLTAEEWSAAIEGARQQLAANIQAATEVVTITVPRVRQRRDA